ncbi:NB-ARC domain-containing protein [Phormidium sp. CCY1219]|uniref:NB-ARC domain-containing protein n=1 Tax=Phormidium sp. CCY1219 TaxID=2886104 RepID=UPI002D1F5545|nr:NB-ARC domain-containing protein [Phormidium sp. CCY1219]MEB3827486.1 LuxR family transcriptional regulator [Phormidium sp. CCY1219]
MSNPIPQDFLKQVAKQRGVSDAELETVIMALDGDSTASIATKLGISNIAVRKRLGEVYRKFSIYGRGPGKLAELRHQLIYQYQDREKEMAPPPPATPKTKTKATPAKTSPTPTPRASQNQDWGEAPDVSQLVKRTEELDILEELIVDEGTRLLVLLGMSGNGKTVLSVQMAKKLQQDFDYIVWRSMAGTPSVEDLLGGIIQSLSTQKKLELPEDATGRITCLLELMRKNRCLVILDDFETVLESDELAGNYRKGYEGYRELIKRCAESTHKSCLTIATDEEPAEISLLEGGKVRTLQPMDYEDVAREIFKDKGVSPTEKEWKELVKRYADNLLAYKIVATTIKDFFNGNTGSFLKATELFVEDTLTDLLEQQFERLSPSEEEIVYWLAIENGPVSISRLRENLLLPVSLSDMLKNLDSLTRRSLIEKQETASDIFFTLPPLVMKFVTSKLVDNACDELKQLMKNQSLENMRIFIQHNLTKEVSSGKKGTKLQGTPVMQQIKNQLQYIIMRTGGYDDLMNILNNMASTLQDKPKMEVGYANVNLRNLVSALGT